MDPSTSSTDENQSIEFFELLLTHMEQHGFTQATGSLFVYSDTEKKLKDTLDKYTQQLVLTQAEFNIITALNNQAKRTSPITILKMSLAEEIQTYINKHFSNIYLNCNAVQQQALLKFFAAFFSLADTAGKNERAAYANLLQAFSEEKITSLLQVHVCIDFGMKSKVKALVDIINKKINEHTSPSDDIAVEPDVESSPFFKDNFIAFEQFIKDVINASGFEVKDDIKTMILELVQGVICQSNILYDNLIVSRKTQKELVRPLLLLNCIAGDAITDKDKQKINKYIETYQKTKELNKFNKSIASLIKHRHKTLKIRDEQLASILAGTSQACPRLDVLVETITVELIGNAQEELSSRFKKLRSLDDHSDSQSLEICYIHRDLKNKLEELNFSEEIGNFLADWLGKSHEHMKATINISVNQALIALMPSLSNIRESLGMTLIVDCLSRVEHDIESIKKDLSELILDSNHKKRGWRKKRNTKSPSDSDSSSSTSSESSSVDNPYRKVQLSQSLEVPSMGKYEANIGFFRSSSTSLTKKTPSSPTKFQRRPPTPSTIRRTSSRDKDTLSSSSPRYKDLVAPNRSQSSPAECLTPRGHGDWLDSEETQLPEIPAFRLK